MGAAKPAAAPTADFAIDSGPRAGPQRVLIYGEGGIGKSTLAALAPSPIFIDVEGGTGHLDVRRVGAVSDFESLRACLRWPGLAAYRSIVLDSATKAEELTVAHTLATVPHEKGHAVVRMEDYGFGKGYQHVYEMFLLLLQDLDAHIRAGRNVVLIAHACLDDAPNPSGDDFKMWAPRLQSPKSGKASIRNRLVEWSDHVMFIGQDVFAKDGKGKGAGTATIWTQPMPTHIAKSRNLRASIPSVLGDGAIFEKIGAVS